MNELLQDFKLAVRHVRSRPLMSLVVIGSLAIGIGGNTTIFSVVDHVLLRPLPYPEASRTLFIQELDRGRPTGGVPARLLDLKRMARSFDELGGWYGESAVVTGLGRPFRIDTQRTFLGYPRLLGSQPVVGRHLTGDEESGLGRSAALIGERLWRERYGARPDIAGQTIHAGGRSFEIVGVLPASASVNPDLQLWAPEAGGAERFPRQARFIAVAARLRPGVNAAAASAELATISRRLELAYPATDRGLALSALPILDRLIEDSKRPLWLLLAAVGFMLLIACLNVAGLLLTRATSRRREMGIRAALGASRGSLARLLLAESALLTVAGGVLGVFFAWWAIDALSRFDLVYIPRLNEAALDWRIGGFAFLLSAVCALVCGLAPAWLGTRADIAVTLRSQGDRGTASAGSHRLRDLFVVAEIALSLMLLTGAGLLLRALSTIRAVPVASQPQDLLAVDLSLPWNSADARIHEFYGRVLAEFQALPGVTSAGFTNALPYAGAYSSGETIVEGDERGPRANSLYHAVSAQYLQTMGAKLLAGRWLSEADREGRPKVTILNQTAARRLFGDRSPVGRRVSLAERKGSYLEVVGVVSDLPREMGSQPFVPEIYQPYRQTYWPMASFVLRAPSGVASLIPQVREAVLRVDPTQVIEKIHTMDEHLASTTALPRYQFSFVGAFAALALFLSGLGVYGIMAQRVADRRREAGIRGALGASPAELLHWTLGRGWMLLASGIGLGLAGSFVVSRALGALLFGVNPFDAAAWTGALLLLLAAAASANIVAGRRILRHDPALVLKDD